MKFGLRSGWVNGMLCSGLFCMIVMAYGQDQNQSDQQSTQQMLQQIQQLQAIQAKQRQELGVVDQPAAPSPSQLPPANQVQMQTPQPAQNQDVNQNQTSQLQGSLYSNNSQSSASNSNSSFEYPFKRAQLPSTPLMNNLSQQAFAGAVRQAIPMTPEQIHRLKQIYTAAQFAAAAPAGVPPRPIATSIFANLSPGATPPVVRLTEGFVTSIVFLDSTGAPWPIAAYDLGNPGAFNIAWDKKDNVLMVQAKTLFTYGNLGVRLRGLNTPIMVTLIPGQKEIDYRADITVPGDGPFAQRLPMDTGLPSQATPILLDVLDGIPPNGSVRLRVSDNVGEAWLLHGMLYLRTHYTLLSPGWLATMASADGTKAYELQRTPMLLVSKHGKMIHVRIGGL